MDLQELQQHWTRLGKDDPLWAVLTHAGKEGGKWNVEEFLATGRAEIDGVLAGAAKAGLKVTPGKALDFGCGVGRLCQGLARHFAEVHGVDISPSMLERARELNQHGTKVTYHLNERDDLGRFESGTFDFVYSNIALQHMDPKYARKYIADFYRVLKPGGVAVFQYIEPIGFRRFVPQGLVDAVRKWKHGDKAFIGMFGLMEGEVRGIITSAGGAVEKVDRSQMEPRWMSLLYWTRRK